MSTDTARRHLEPTARIARRRDYGEDLFLLWLEPRVDFRFAPGQYITIGFQGFERPYSIVSAPHEPLIELFVEHVRAEHGGVLTPLLHRRVVGDLLTMRPEAKGRFTRRSGIRNHVMVATVTGIAPYVSIIRDFIHQRTLPSPVDESRFFVLHGASHQDEFVYDTELLSLHARHPDSIHFVGSVSRPGATRNAGWTGSVGRVNVLVEPYLDRWRLRQDETLIYLCGNPGMVDDATARLTPKGWNVTSERYWQEELPAS